MSRPILRSYHISGCKQKESAKIIYTGIARNGNRQSDRFFDVGLERCSVKSRVVRSEAALIMGSFRRWRCDRVQPINTTTSEIPIGSWRIETDTRCTPIRAESAYPRYAYSDTAERATISRRRCHAPPWAMHQPRLTNPDNLRLSIRPWCSNLLITQ